jgi:hypothetical protein
MEEESKSKKNDLNFLFLPMKPEHASAIAAIQEAVYPTPYHEDVKFVIQRSILFPPGSWVVIRKKGSRDLLESILESALNSTTGEFIKDSNHYHSKEISSSVVENKNILNKVAAEVDVTHYDLLDSIQKHEEDDESTTNNHQLMQQTVTDKQYVSCTQILAGNDEGDMIGYMAAYPWPSSNALEKPPSLGDEKTIEMIARGASDPSCAHFFIHEVTLYAQGEGIGKIAMDFLLRIGKRMGFKQAMLVAVLGNESYWNKSCGFHEYKKLPDGYYKQEKDECYGEGKDERVGQDQQDDGKKESKRQELTARDGTSVSQGMRSQESLSVLENGNNSQSFMSLLGTQKLEKRKSFFSTDWRVTVMNRAL